jgi:hypothetical protein
VVVPVDRDVRGPHAYAWRRYFGGERAQILLPSGSRR